MLALSLSWAARPAEAQPARKGAKAANGAVVANLPALETWELANGLRVAFMPVRRAPVVSVQLWYHAGSKDEPRERRGTARMFERLMFGGSEHLRPNHHRAQVERLGGSASAVVTEDASGYQNTAPSPYLDHLVRLEAERMRGLALRNELVDEARTALKEDLRRQSRDAFKRGVWQFLDTAYTVHPYAWEAGGRSEDLDKIELEELQGFYDRNYQPNNALLVVVGDVDEADVRVSVDKWFGGIARGKPPRRPADDKTEPEQKNLRRRVAEKGQIGLLIAGYHIPEAKHPDIYALQALSLILGVGSTSRLHQRLVRDERVARDAGCSAIVREHPGLFVVFGAFDRPDQGDKVEAILLDEVGKLQKRGPTAAELRKAKNAILTGFVFGLERSSDLANQIAVSWILTGDPGQFLRDISQFQALKAADVKRVAAEYLTKSNLTVVVAPPATREGGR